MISYHWSQTIILTQEITSLKYIKSKKEINVPFVEFYVNFINQRSLKSAEKLYFVLFDETRKLHDPLEPLLISLPKNNRDSKGTIAKPRFSLELSQLPFPFRITRMLEGLRVPQRHSGVDRKRKEWKGTREDRIEMKGRSG